MFASDSNVGLHSASGCMYVTVRTTKSVSDYIHTRVCAHTAKHCMHPPLSMCVKVKGVRDRDTEIDRDTETHR